MSQTLGTSNIGVADNIATRAPNADSYETGAAFETSLKGVEDGVSTS